MLKRVALVLAGLCALTLVTLAVLLATDRGRGTLVDALPQVERLYTRWVPPTPPVGSELFVQAERDAVAWLAAQVSGRLLWSSNRSGNHELYLAVLTTGEIYRLTDDPHVDYFSRFSPDGTQISFLRSRRPWVSFREEDGWDLYLMDADGANARRVAERAYHPMWVPDGSGVTFVRNNLIMRLDLATGRETVLEDGSVPPIEGRISEAELGADGRLVVTVRHEQQRVGVVNQAGTEYTALSEPGACEITWWPNADRVLWMSSTGTGGTRVMHGRPDAAGGDVLIDLPGPYSHEYFPRLTADGRWLIWGAAAEGHEHDRADYEIFVWQLGTPWDTTRRLTHSPANDQWPDLFVEP